jgi:O-antigen ligase
MLRALKNTPWPVLLLLVSFLCPTELSIYIGSARLPPHRALLLILAPIAVFRILSRGGIQPKGFDFAFFGFAVWTVVGYVHHHGQADGLQTGVALAIDSFGSFLVARAFVRDEQAFVGTSVALLMAVIVAGAFALPEMLLGQIFVHEFLKQVTGYVHPVGIETRLGLTRAFGTFDHPIHLGTFCASSLALAFYAARKELGALIRGVIITVCALASLSSAPMLSLALQAGLISFEQVTRGIRGRVTMALGGLAIAFAAVAIVATRSPFAIIATGFTLDSWTGYYRLMIWENGLQNVWANPWMGLGLNDWERPLWMVSSTIDAFWLVIAIRGGIPAFLLLTMGVFLVGWGVASRIRQSDRTRTRLATGWMISLIALSLVGCTVHYWNVPYAYFFFFVGLGGWLADPLRRAATRKVAVRAAVPRTTVQWLAPEALPAGSRVLQYGRKEDWSVASPSPKWPVPVIP